MLNTPSPKEKRKKSECRCKNVKSCSFLRKLTLLAKPRAM